MGLMILTYIFLLKPERNGKSAAASSRRNAVVINFVVTWFISSICYSLLLYFERADPLEQALDVEYLQRLCLTQAALTSASQALTSISTLALVLNLALAVTSGGIPLEKTKRKYMTLSFVIIPYAIFLAFFVETFLLGNQRFPVNINMNPNGPPIISPTDNLSLPTIFYCIIVTGTNDYQFPILPSSYIFSMLSMGLTLLIEIYLVWYIRKMGRLDGNLRRVYKSTLVRVIVFSVYRMWALGMLIVEVAAPVIVFVEGEAALGTFTAFAELVLAAGPLTAFLLLGSKTSVLNAWGLKRRKSSAQAMANVRRARIKSKRFDDDRSSRASQGDAAWDVERGERSIVESPTAEAFEQTHTIDTLVSLPSAVYNPQKPLPARPK